MSSLQRRAIATFALHATEEDMARVDAVTVQELQLTHSQMRSESITNPMLTDRVTRLANCVEHTTLIGFGRAHLDRNVSAARAFKDKSLELLLEIFATRAELEAMRRTTRADIGLALLGLSRVAQLHIWHGSPFQQALQSKAFVAQMYTCARLYGSENKWRQVASLTKTQRGQCQRRFASFVLGLLEDAEAPDVMAEASEWHTFVDLAATAIGMFMLSRLGHDPTDNVGMARVFDMQASTICVGQQQDLCNLLTTYLNVAIDLTPVGELVAENIAKVWGLHRFYDVFFTDDRRRNETCKLRTTFMASYISCVRKAFIKAADDKRKSCAATAIADPVTATMLGDKLIAEEIDQKLREHDRVQKRREKRRRRKNRHKNDANDAIAMHAEGTSDVESADDGTDDAQEDDNASDTSMLVNVDEAEDGIEDVMDGVDAYEPGRLFDEQTLVTLFDGALPF